MGEVHLTVKHEMRGRGLFGNMLSHVRRSAECSVMLVRRAWQLNMTLCIVGIDKTKTQFCFQTFVLISSGHFEAMEKERTKENRK